MCLSCEKTYIGETSRQFGTRLKEHKTESEKASQKAYTRAQQKALISGEANKSAITDYVSINDNGQREKQKKATHERNPSG